MHGALNAVAGKVPPPAQRGHEPAEATTMATANLTVTMLRSKQRHKQRKQTK
jgi:hypothetical protein